MEAPWPSLTASLVAFARGVSYDGRRVDDATRFLLPLPLRLGLRALDRSGPLEPGLRTLTRLASLGLVDHASLRSLAIDDVVRSAWKDGARQLVLLGAGLDSRAYRLRELATGTVFEVDHPTTQRFKAKRVRGREPVAPRRLVSLDFEQESFEERLPKAGFDASLRTVWVLEGLTMYLSFSALFRTFEALRAISAPGSVAAITYIEPEMSAVGAAFRDSIQWAFDSMGESLDGLISTEAIHALLAESELRIVSDTDARDWSGRHGGNPDLARSFLFERLALAEAP